jgi:RHS repeat-associated protein
MATKETFHVTTDAQGSVMAVLDGTGAVLERRSYDAYGQVTYMAADGTVIPESPTGLEIGYRGQPMDSTTGLYGNKAQWYSPTLGNNLGDAPPAPTMRGGPNRLTFVVECQLSVICEKVTTGCPGEGQAQIYHPAPVLGYGESEDQKEAVRLAVANAKAIRPPCPPGFTDKGEHFTSRVVSVR